MANSTKVAPAAAAAAAMILVFLQVSCAVSQPVGISAEMTVNGFEQGEGGGGPAACDGQYHSDQEYVVSLSSQWFEGGARCGKEIRIQYAATQYAVATVVDECGGCDNEVGASPVIWRTFNLDPALGEVTISWSDF